METAGEQPPQQPVWFVIPVKKKAPGLYKWFEFVGLEYVLEVRSKVHVALWFYLIISLVYGLIWLADVLQFECVSCLFYQPIGIVIFFANCWCAAVLLSTYDATETGELINKMRSLHSEIATETNNKSKGAMAKNNELSRMLSHGLFKELTVLIEEQRLILSRCDDQTVRGKLLSCMAGRLLIIRKSTISHLHFVSAPVRTHRHMRQVLDEHVNDGTCRDRVRDLLDSCFLIFGKESPEMTGLSQGEKVLWPKTEMRQKLEDADKQLKLMLQTMPTSADGSAETSEGLPVFRRVLNSPACKYLLFGLGTNVILLIFYVYTASHLFHRLNEEDCDKLCWLNAVDGIIRKFVGILATACQVGATSVIISKLDKLDPILLMRLNIEGLRDMKLYLEKLASVFSGLTEENIGVAAVNREICEEKGITGDFVREKLAAGNSLQSSEFEQLLYQLRRPRRTMSGYEALLSSEAV